MIQSFQPSLMTALRPPSRTPVPQALASPVLFAGKGRLESDAVETQPLHQRLGYPAQVHGTPVATLNPEPMAPIETEITLTKQTVQRTIEAAHGPNTYNYDEPLLLMSINGTPWPMNPWVDDDGKLQNPHDRSAGFAIAHDILRHILSPFGCNLMTIAGENLTGQVAHIMQHLPEGHQGWVGPLMELAANRSELYRLEGVLDDVACHAPEGSRLTLRFRQYPPDRMFIYPDEASLRYSPRWFGQAKGRTIVTDQTVYTGHPYRPTELMSVRLKTPPGGKYTEMGMDTDWGRNEVRRGLKALPKFFEAYQDQLRQALEGNLATEFFTQWSVIRGFLRDREEFQQTGLTMYPNPFAASMPNDQPLVDGSPQDIRRALLREFKENPHSHNAYGLYDYRRENITPGKLPDPDDLHLCPPPPPPMTEETLETLRQQAQQESPAK